jgi:vesicle coat complex subunit
MILSISSWRTLRKKTHRYCCAAVIILRLTKVLYKVQLQLLTATVKLFLKKPNENQDLVQRILQTATTECDNADIRDRAYVYWRLLSTDPQAAKVK